MDLSADTACAAAHLQRTAGNRAVVALLNRIPREATERAVVTATLQRACGPHCGCAGCREDDVELPAQRTVVPSMLQRKANVLRHSGRWGDIDSPAMLGLWAKEAAINKLWFGSTLRDVQEHPEKVPELVEGDFPSYVQPFTARRSSPDHPKPVRMPTKPCACGGLGYWEPVLEEFVGRYTKQLSQALAHVPKGCELVTRPEEIWRVRNQQYMGIWWHRMHFCACSTNAHRARFWISRRVPREAKTGAPGDEIPCATSGSSSDGTQTGSTSPPTRGPTISIGSSATSPATSPRTRNSPLNSSTLDPAGGFSLGLSSRLAFILAGELLSALGEQGTKSARGEKMQSALDILKGIGFGVVTAHFANQLFGRSRRGELVADVDNATEQAAFKGRAEVARTDAALVERELRAGKARAVKDPDLLADGYRIEVEVMSEGQKHTWRQNANGSWCRFSNGALCVGQLGDSVNAAARQHPPHIERDLVAAGVSAQARNRLGKQTLSVNDLVTLHPAAIEKSTGWIRVTRAVERGHDEFRVYLASEYGLADYIRYHIRAPGLGKEGYPITLARTWMNHGANNIETFMRSMRKRGFTVDFNATRTTFGGEELRPFFEGIIQRGSRDTLNRLALDRARIERFLKSMTYGIRLYRVVGGRAETQLWRAVMEAGPPPPGNQVRLVLPQRVQ